jgi:hypothetical protein
MQALSAARRRASPRIVRHAQIGQGEHLGIVVHAGGQIDTAVGPAPPQLENLVAQGFVQRAWQGEQEQFEELVQLVMHLLGGEFLLASQRQRVHCIGLRDCPPRFTVWL